MQFEKLVVDDRFELNTQLLEGKNVDEYEVKGIATHILHLLSFTDHIPRKKDDIWRTWLPVANDETQASV